MSERTPLLLGSSAPGGGGGGVCADTDLAALPVYHTIHLVYNEVMHNVDVPLSDEQLRSPEIQFAIIQPLEQYLGEMNDPSIVYVLLLCRLHFIRERDSALASSTLNETRAQLCELLAIKLLRHQATEARGSSAGLLAMSRALVGGFHAFQGAGDEVLARIRKNEGFANRVIAEGAGKTNALELAILGKARHFIKSQATQRVITAVWEGKVVYSSSSFLDILPDRWKMHQIRLYNIKSAPLLDHYRLRVPKYRSLIELGTFMVLFASFIAVIMDRRNRHEHLPVSALTGHEYWFFFYALGYSVDKMASIAEHGWSVYSAGLTNGLDAMCVPIFAVAFGFRLHSIITNDSWASDQAFAVLSCAATLMFPRLAFAAISNNVLILSLRAMLADFFWLMGIAVFCFLGFVFALSHLCEGDYSVARIGEWLVFIWFGLDGTGIDSSPEFHKLLGPILMVSYAALSNTLLVSLLVAILSSTYAAIAEDAVAEDMFRKAVMTFEGVKSDSLFDYVPPLNLIALCVMWPISHFASPRWFHKINVATTRILSLPILLIIALYERQTAAGSPIRGWIARTAVKLTASLPTKWAQKLSLLEGAHWECEAVFEYSPAGDEKEDEDDDFGSLTDEDDVEDALESPRTNRVSSRASHIIAPNNQPPGSSSTSPQGSRSQSRGRVRSPSPPPSPPPAPPSRPTPISPRKHAHFSGGGGGGGGGASHERLPSNASVSGFGRRTTSPTRSDSALSTSMPARYTSPLAELYQHRDVEHSGGAGGFGGIRRRMSVGTRAPPTPTAEVFGAEPPGQTQLREMVQSLAATLARLEAKLDGRGDE